jgi:hypothetical protein
MEILKRLREAVRRKRPELQPNDLILHHDDALAHKALSVKQFLAQKFINKMEHPPYSYDFAPNDLRLFPKMKNVLTVLKAIPQQDLKNVSNSGRIVGLSA